MRSWNDCRVQLCREAKRRVVWGIRAPRLLVAVARLEAGEEKSGFFENFFSLPAPAVTRTGRKHTWKAPLIEWLDVLARSGHEVALVTPRTPSG